MKLRWKKGAALLQALVMSVLLSMIAVMLMKWVLARYLMAARNYRSTAATTRAYGYSQERASTWGYTDLTSNISPSGSASVSMDAKTVSYSISSVSGQKTITINTEED